MDGLNFADLFEALAREVGERTALIHGERSIKWAEFDQRSNRLARWLQDKGLAPGAKVGFYLRNSPAYCELFAACVKARLVHVNVNYRYVDRELHHVLDNADVEALVFDADFAPQVLKLQSRLPKLKVGIQVNDYHPAESSEPDTFEMYADFEQICSKGDDSPLKLERSGDDLLFMYTGGTTGMPKAVMWRQADRIAIFGMAEGTPEAHARTIAGSAAVPIHLPACPLMHSTGLTSTLSALCRGGTVVTLKSRRFDPIECLREIERNQVQSVAIVGDAFAIPILDALRDGERFDLRSVKTIRSAGVMWRDTCKSALQAYFPNALMHDSFGSSEGSGLGVSISGPEELVPTGVFRPGPGVTVLAEDFREVIPGSGEAGMIAKSGNVPVGYYKDPERSARTFPVINGIRYTLPGDWGTIEADGTLKLLGRGSGCINTGGEKVYPEEVEEALKSHPGVVDAFVVGMPDPKWGQCVLAVICTRQDESLSLDDLRPYLDARLARYKHPKEVFQMSEAPRAPNGKADLAAVGAFFT